VLDRLRYLAHVKAELANESGTYDVFMDVLFRFKTEKLDTPGVIRHMREIFGQKPALLEGFQILMLPSYEKSS
jgi:histone deacetylase complex regulatory component SIN3